jgi:phosphatidylglycerophosphatase A
MVVFIPFLAPQPVYVQVFACAIVTVVGIFAADRTAVGMGIADPSDVVIDELAGVWVAAIGTTDTRGWILAFVLFRAFDILKPFPVRRAESIPGGVGIVADDIAAGLLALGCTQLAIAWWA